ncbi:MAG: AAA family ATPase [Saprospiraceae bacterium]
MFVKTNKPCQNAHHWVHPDFKGVIEQNMYYVDKTALVRAVVDGAKVQLYCRPRRFGKTLNNDAPLLLRLRGRIRYLFNGMAVSQDEEMMTLYQR